MKDKHLNQQDQFPTETSVSELALVRCGHISDPHQENIADIVVSDLRTEDFGTLELLFVTGDLTYRGDIDKLKRIAEQAEDLVKYGYVKDVVLIPGNHDKSFDPAFRKNNWFNPQIARAQFADRPGVHMLIHQAIELHGIKIFGSPWTPEFCNWGFNYFPHQAHTLWKDIPEDCEVLLTHGPPHMILDQVQDYMGIKFTGCPVLAHEIIKRPSIKYHLFGHIHEGYGKVEQNGTFYINSSIMNERYKPVNRPQYFQITR